MYVRDFIVILLNTCCYICILAVLAIFYDMCNPEILCHCLFYWLLTCTLSEMMNKRCPIVWHSQLSPKAMQLTGEIFTVLCVNWLFFLAATKQLYEWYFLSVCPSVRLSVRLSVCLSVRLSVCHTFLTMFPSSYHHEIFRSYHIGPG